MHPLILFGAGIAVAALSAAALFHDIFAAGLIVGIGLAILALWTWAEAAILRVAAFLRSV